MHGRVVFPEELNVDMLRVLFEDARFTITIDTDGDIQLDEPNGKYKCYVMPAKDGRHVKLQSLLFAPRDGTTREMLLALANQINLG